MIFLIIFAGLMLIGCGNETYELSGGLNSGRPSEIRSEIDVNEGLRKHVIDLTIKPSQTRFSGSYKK